MDRSPQVSIITPTRNRLKLLLETIASVQSQNFVDWEHLIIDDGSNDGTADTIGIRAAADQRIRYLRPPDNKSGANTCRNFGISQSRASLIVLLDSDDLLRPNCLERRVEVMNRNLDLDFAVFRAGVFRKYVGDIGRLYHPQDPSDNLLRMLSLECPWQTSGPIWRRSFIEKIGCFDESLLSMQDLEMHVRAISAGGRYICFPEVDHDIRGQDDASKISMRHFNDPAYIQAAENVGAKLSNALTSNGLLTWSRQRALVGLSFGVAESWLRAGGMSQAVRSWVRSCCQHGVSPSFSLMGCLMLFIRAVSFTETGLCARLVNKWKGWVRFRQEPALLPIATQSRLHDV